MAAVDLAVSNGSYELDHYFDTGKAMIVADQLSLLAGVDHVELGVVDQTSVLNGHTGLLDPRVTILGVGSSSLSNLGGAYRMDGEPLMVEPDADEVFINPNLATSLKANLGDSLMLTDGDHVMAVRVAALIDDRGLGGYGGKGVIIMNMGTAALLKGHDDKVNKLLIVVSGDFTSSEHHGPDVMASVGEVVASHPLGLDLYVSEDKRSEIENNREAMSVFTNTFFVFAGFATISGIAFCANVFMLLGEERGCDMSVLRRLGLRKRDIWYLFLVEGLVYGILASLLGTFLGLGISRLIFSAIGGAISINQRSLDQYFVFQESSLVVAFFIGLVSVMISVALVAWRVGAWNQGRASGPNGTRSKMNMASLAGVITGSTISLTGLLYEDYSLLLVGISIIGLSIGNILVIWMGRRLAWSLVGMVLLLIWVPGTVGLGTSAGGLETLLTAGVFCTVAVSIIILVNAPYISRLFVRWDKDGIGHLSFTYLDKEWRKTFMSLFIFTIIVLTLTLSFAISVMISEGVPSMMREATGGLDVICLTDPERPIEPDLRTRLEGGALQSENITTIVPLYCSQVGLMDDERSYNLIGFGDDLIRSTDYPLNDYDKQTYGDQEDVWQAVAADPHLAIVDGGLARDLVKAVVGYEVSGVALGTTIELNASAGQVVHLTVVGVMEQRTFSGIFINASLAKETMALRAPNVFMISFAPGLDRGEQVHLLERELIYNGALIIDVDAEAEHWQNVMDDVLLIFQSFLALTLVTGICAITLGRMRAIHARRRDLRVLRAIGMNGKMLVRGQLIEASFVAIAGTVMGCVIGVLVVMSVWDMTFKDAGVPLQVPYWNIAIMAVVTLGVTMATVVPVCMSARKVASEEEKQIL